MITTMNFLFCNEETPVQTESTIVSQSLANIKVAENLNSLMYFPGELKEVLRNEIYINFSALYIGTTTLILIIIISSSLI